MSMLNGKQDSPIEGPISRIYSAKQAIPAIFWRDATSQLSKQLAGFDLSGRDELQRGIGSFGRKDAGFQENYSRQES